MSLNPKPLDVPDVINMVYPIGSIYETEDSEFNPNVLWGGTWERIKGRVLVGVDENDADFDTSGKTGGEKTHILTTSELASHNHSFTGTAVTSGKGSEHTHTFTGKDVTSGGQSQSHTHGMGIYSNDQESSNFGLQLNGAGFGGRCMVSGGSFSTGNASQGHTHTVKASGTNSKESSHTHSVTASGTIESTGSGNGHNNLQPFETVYIWKRVA